MKTRTALPARGRRKEDVLAELKTFGADDPHYREGRLWSLVYYLDEDYASYVNSTLQQAVLGRPRVLGLILQAAW